MRGTLVWKHEDVEADGEPVGPVWVEYDDGDAEDDAWDRWARRSEAEAYAQQHGLRFVADE